VSDYWSWHKAVVMFKIISENSFQCYTRGRFRMILHYGGAETILNTDKLEGVRRITNKKGCTNRLLFICSEDGRPWALAAGDPKLPGLSRKIYS